MWSDLATIIIGPTRALNITYFCIGKPCCRILIYSSMTITIQVIHDHPEHKHMFIICIMFCKMNSLISNFISLAMTDVLQYLPTALFVYYCDVPSFPGSFPESNNFLNSILNSIHSSSAISLSTLERKPSGTCDLQILSFFSVGQESFLMPNKHGTLYKRLYLLKSPPSNYYSVGSTESPPSNYYIGGSTCIMTFRMDIYPQEPILTN